MYLLATFLITKISVSITNFNSKKLPLECHAQGFMQSLTLNYMLEPSYCYTNLYLSQLVG